MSQSSRICPSEWCAQLSPKSPNLHSEALFFLEQFFFSWNRLCEETTIIQSAKSKLCCTIAYIYILHPYYFACSFLWLHHEARTVERSQGPDIGVLQHWRPVLWRWQLLGALCSLGRQVSSKGPQMVGEPKWGIVRYPPAFGSILLRCESHKICHGRRCQPGQANW